MTTIAGLLADGRAGLVAPGVYDALTALLAEEAGFDCLYLSGASIAYTRLGQPMWGSCRWPRSPTRSRSSATGCPSR